MFTILRIRRNYQHCLLNILCKMIVWKPAISTMMGVDADIWGCEEHVYFGRTRIVVVNGASVITVLDSLSQINGLLLTGQAMNFYD